ncbi:uncharacterized protein [Apostichopus japonicus]|uniref:uncharacterized protein isoform X2 n=1 Tax=Stichopus japonicus TaxID=307972 RepID=UPI003AB7B9ED
MIQRPQANMAGDRRGWVVAGMIVVIATVTAFSKLKNTEAKLEDSRKELAAMRSAELKNCKAELEDLREEHNKVLAMISAELKNTEAKLEDLREEHYKVLAMRSDLVRDIEQLQLGDQQLSQEASQIISDIRRDLFCHHSYRERIQRMMEQFYRTRTNKRVKEIF